MAFLDFLMGSKPTESKLEQVQRFTPEQQQVLNQILGQASGMMPSGMGFLESILGQSPEAMQQFQAPARRAFEEQTIPSIAERFSSKFGMGGQRSSAFPQILGQAGAGLEEALSAQRAGLGFQGLGQLQQLLGMGLTPQFETGIRPGKEGTSGLLGSLLQAAGQAAGMSMGLGLPGAISSGLGSLGKLFQSSRDRLKQQSPDTYGKVARFL